MRNVVLLALIASTPTFAGEVYKCKGANGAITFTNIKCPDHTASEHYATYQPEADMPPPVPAQPAAQAPTESAVVSGVSSSAPMAVQQRVAPASVQAPVQPMAAPVSQPPIQPAPVRTHESAMPPAIEQAVPPVARRVIQPADEPTASAPPTVASGYKCVDGDNVWLQSTPCPPASSHASARPIPKPAAEAPPTIAPIEIRGGSSEHEDASSQGPLCDQLIAQASAAGQKGGTGTDELNRLLTANGCKR